MVRKLYELRWCVLARSFFGGVHPKGYKELTREAPIVPIRPQVVSIAMSQHIGAPCRPLVNVGDRVTVGQKVGDGPGLCVPVHASVSGLVIAIENRPHPGGTEQQAVVIENDGPGTPSAPRCKSGRASPAFPQRS